jgi:hypothetical protein
VEGQGEGQRGVVSSGRGAGGHVAWRRAAQGSWGSRKRPAKAAVGRRGETEGGRAGGRR